MPDKPDQALDLEKHSKLLHAIIADLKRPGHKDKDVFINDDGSYEISVGDIREIAKDMLELAEKLEKAVSKELLLRYLNQRIAYYDMNKFSEHSREYNYAIVNAYKWLKILVEQGKLESATNEEAQKGKDAP